jgi:hypothetical protein
MPRYRYPAATGEAQQALRMIAQDIPPQGRLALGPGHPPGSDKPAKVAVAFVVLCEQGEVCAVFECEFCADDGLEANFLRSEIERHQAVQARRDR